MRAESSGEKWNMTVSVLLKLRDGLVSDRRQATGRSATLTHVTVFMSLLQTLCAESS